MEFPIRPALARAVPTLPTGPGWHFEIKLDGHRMILRRTDDGVICYSRTGRTVTSHWMDLAVPAMVLPPGTVLDGEAHPDHGQDALAARPYTERRTALVDVLAHVGPPLQPVLATDDRDTALQWYETLQPQGVEGVVAKPSGSAYPFGGRTVWCVDCTIW
ncbi:ATP-dependent DNA ligase [Streptomyces parvus]|uniref:ATP-dependent DNA ligase n=1 Tax=Streptomyces parvus TaxID=66428 RepID=UPI00210145D1|nr:hypothetical protein [Streptomyces parvus]MCQ1582550.1 hypothetical protein [Streptomyces parvus]MCQ1582703.1 hypothetical protein [Streptomyces parvus]